MPHTSLPVWHAWQIVAMIAWVICGLYFIASAFLTQKIRQKEAGGKRTLDQFLILGGYVLLFPVLHGALWDRPLLSAAWMAPLGKIGAVMAVIGLAFTIWARKTLGQYWSRIVAVKEDHKLVQSGPYRVIRHPLYTGLLLAIPGTALTFGLWRCFIGAALVCAAFLWRARREDELLAGQFGAEFAAYRARSGRLLPRWN